jgi:hypothetical protein
MIRPHPKGSDAMVYVAAALAAVSQAQEVKAHDEQPRGMHIVELHPDGTPLLSVQSNMPAITATTVASSFRLS